MPQHMVLRPRGACCTTWHPGDMVQVAAFPLISHNIQLSQEGSGDSLFVYLGDAESIGSNGERRQERETRDLFPYFVITGYTVPVILELLVTFYCWSLWESHRHTAQISS
jgi:hypothetical protein